MKFHRSILRAARLAAAVFLLVAPALAQPAAMPANELLRRAVANELHAENSHYYAWTDRLDKPRGSVTKLMVSTPHGILARSVNYNGRALSADERRQEDERIDRLLDPANMKEKQHKQHDDQQRIERLLAAMPDGLLCDYAQAADEHTLRLECSPNPHYSPPNYESQILAAMRATILIDRQQQRIASLHATLIRDVGFGWGFVGKLNRGGHLELEQVKVAGDHWRIARLHMTFEGRLLLLKPLHIEETESAWEYRMVPAMTVPQAVEYLRNAAK